MGDQGLLGTGKVRLANYLGQGVSVRQWWNVTKYFYFVTLLK